MILPALQDGGYACTVQVNVGQRLGCGSHVVDAVAEKNAKKFLISVKWQQVSEPQNKRFRSRSSV